MATAGKAGKHHRAIHHEAGDEEHDDDGRRHAKAAAHRRVGRGPNRSNDSTRPRGNTFLDARKFSPSTNTAVTLSLPPATLAASISARTTARGSPAHSAAVSKNGPGLDDDRSDHRCTAAARRWSRTKSRGCPRTRDRRVRGARIRHRDRPRCDGDGASLRARRSRRASSRSPTGE